MNSLRQHLQRLAWIALVAVLALVLAPTLSHALAQVAQVAQPDHCATASPLAMESDAQADTSQDQGLFHRCGFCALGLVALSPPPARPALAGPRPLALAAHPWRLQGPAQPPAWRGAQPRAPPRRA